MNIHDQKKSFEVKHREIELSYPGDLKQLG